MDTRQIALRIINQVLTENAYANIALAHEISNYDLSDQDRRFLTELVYGTIKAVKTLDWIIGHYVNRPINKIAPIILDVLRLGIYQLFFMDKVPDSAACNQAVELAKKYGHAGTVKFVNGVLRAASRNPSLIKYPDKKTQPVRYLALKYFHPEWMISRWIDRFGFEDTEKLCQSNNSTPPLSVRTNTLKTTRKELMSILQQEGVLCSESIWAPEGIIFHKHPALSTLKSLQTGLFQVQDESSMLVAHVLDPKPGDFVIDACGAPGGKTTHIAQIMANQGKIVCVDIHEHKLALTRENADRLGIKIIETKNINAELLRDNFSNQADCVLVDAPCSGWGVIRRKPDSRWRKSKQQIAELSRLQISILTSAADCVKLGGTLVYSTCTTEPEENSCIVEEFLSLRQDFVLDKTGSYLPCNKSDESMIQLLPHRHNVDGFFIARLTRVK